MIELETLMRDNFFKLFDSLYFYRCEDFNFDLEVRKSYYKEMQEISQELALMSTALAGIAERD